MKLKFQLFEDFFHSEKEIQKMPNFQLFFISSIDALFLSAAFF